MKINSSRFSMATEVLGCSDEFINKRLRANINVCEKIFKGEDIDDKYAAEIAMLLGVDVSWLADSDSMRKAHSALSDVAGTIGDDKLTSLVIQVGMLDDACRNAFLEAVKIIMHPSAYK